MPISSKPGRILIYGLDPVLLSTRRMILEHAGFQVEVTHNPDDFQARVGEAEFELLVVCHTVPHPEQVHIAQSANRPPQLLQVPVLLLPDTFLGQVQQLVG